VKATFSLGERYRVTFRLPPMVPAKVVLATLKARLRDVRVESSTAKTLTICATWKGQPETIETDLLISCANVEPAVR
jgi:hypothetical protein